MIPWNAVLARWRAIIQSCIEGCLFAALSMTVPFVASAQDEVPKASKGTPHHSQVGDRPNEAGWPSSSWALYGRLLFPEGTIIPDVDPGSFFGPPSSALKKGTGFSDVLGTGLGAALEWDLMWKLRDDTDDDIRVDELGGYVSTGLDLFSGKSFSDDLGDMIRPKSWNYFTVVTGANMTLCAPSIPGLFGGVRVGVGMVRYSPMDATFSFNGGPIASGELLAGTVGVASEAALFLGFRTQTFTVRMGFDLQINQSPNRGRDAANSVKPDILAVPSFEMGIEYRF